MGSYVDQVVAGEIKRLMIFAPPQHGKSEQVSVRLPAYWLGRNPNLPVIVTSYAASLAEKKAEFAREVVRSNEYKAVFPKIRLSPHSQEKRHWSLANPYRGSMLAAGVDGPVTGNGAGLVIVDDPFENWRQANSLTMRNHVWDWYRTTLRTRVWEGGAIIIIMTR